MYNKYDVTKLEGETDPNAEYFVLRLDTDKHALAAVIAYAESIRDDDPELAEDLLERVEFYKVR